MTMQVANFSSPQSLADFVNDQAIPQAQIVDIVQRSGQWYLFYFA